MRQDFRKGRTGRPANLDIVVVKICIDRLALANAAKVMGLGTCSVDAPWTNNKKPSPDRWARRCLEVDARSREEAARSKQTFASEQTKTQTPRQPGPKSVPKEKTKAPGAAQSGSESMLPPAAGMASAPSR